jgi:PAS domain S-box-containing protein
MADSSPVMIWITDAKGQLEFANRAFLDFFGIPSRRSAMRFDWGSVIHASDRQAYLDAFRASVDGRTALIARARVRRRDGEWRWVESRANPRIDGDGRVTGVIGSSPDITEMFESQEALREADRRKDEFLAILAHELRNPLAPLRNGLEILKRRGTDATLANEARQMMERQLRQMVRLVDDLLDVSRITTGKLALKREVVPLADVIRSAIDTVKPLIDARRHVLGVTLPAERVDVDGDATRLAQVFSNLLNNAANYTQPGGRINVVASANDREVTVAIRDNGIGIAPEMLANVFRMFAQADASLERVQEGLGVGLTLARHLVELHGGTIEARSEGSGCGSEFVVRLPRARRGAASPPEPVASGSAL